MSICVSMYTYNYTYIYMFTYIYIYLHILWKPFKNNGLTYVYAIFLRLAVYKPFLFSWNICSPDCLFCCFCAWSLYESSYEIVRNCMSLFFLRQIVTNHGKFRKNVRYRCVFLFWSLVNWESGIPHREQQGSQQTKVLRP